MRRNESQSSPIRGAEHERSEWEGKSWDNLSKKQIHSEKRKRATLSTVIAGLYSAPINRPHLLIFKRKKKLYINKPRLSISRRCPRNWLVKPADTRVWSNQPTRKFYCTHYTDIYGKHIQTAQNGKERRSPQLEEQHPVSFFVALSLSFVCALNVTFLPRQIRPWACAVLLITPGSHRTLKRRAAPRLPRAVKRRASYATLCYAMLRYATLCYAMLRYATLRREAIVSASSLFSPLAAIVSRQETHWKMSCMCDHRAESQDDRRGEMRVRCKQPSAGALGISAALRRSFRFRCKQPSAGARVRCGPSITQQSSLKEPLVMVDSLTLLHAVRIHWQTWEKVALRMRPVFVKDFSPLVIQASHWTRISTLN